MAKVQVDGWAASGPTRPPAPEQSPPGAMPPDDGFGPHDEDGREEVAEPPGESREEPSVEGAQARSLDLPAQYDDLLAQEEVFRDEHGAWGHEGEHEVSYELEESSHGGSGLTTCSAGQGAGLEEAVISRRTDFLRRTAIGARRLQVVARAIGLPVRKVRLLRWDVEIDLAAGVVSRSGEEPVKLTTEAVAILQKRRDGMRGFAGVGDLVFPSEVGGFVSPSCLDKPFLKIAEAAKIKKPITPRAMRRTAQDLSRLAGVNDLVTRAVSGHSDVAMQELYSTIRGEEMRKSLAAVVQLAGLSGG